MCMEISGENDRYFPTKMSSLISHRAIHREKELYPDPETFNPDRWLSPEYPTYREPLSVFPNIQGYSALGFGRRQCPGTVIAENSLFLEVACIAWGCDISLKKDEQGRDIPCRYMIMLRDSTHSRISFHLVSRYVRKGNGRLLKMLGGRAEQMVRICRADII
jgi:cytochrome P450